VGCCAISLVVYRRFTGAYHLYHPDEAVSTSETSVDFYQTTLSNIPGGCNLRELYSSCNVMRVIKVRMLRFADHVAYIKETRDVQTLSNSVALQPEGSSPHSQEPATSPYPEPVESTPHLPAILPMIHSDPIRPSTPRSSEWSPSFGLSHQNLVTFLSSPMRDTSPAHFILLDLICLMIFGDENKL
jgi:hypothetical protein